MNAFLRPCFFVVMMVAILGSTNFAWGEVVKKSYPKGTVTRTCQGVFDQINADSGVFSPPSNFGASVNSQISFTNFSTGDIKTDTDGATSGEQSIEIINTSQNEKFFDYIELPTAGPQGFDAILFVGKAENIFFDIGASGGANIGDINSPAGNPTLVLVCSQTTGAPPNQHAIFGANCPSSPDLHDNLCETYLNDQVDSGRGQLGNPLLPVLYTTATPGNAVTNACGCLWEQFQEGGSRDSEFEVAPATFGQCNPKPICDNVLGNSITDCPATNPEDDFCVRNSGTTNPNNCCSGFVSVAPSVDFSSAPLAGSCVTEFNIGGTSYLYSWDGGPPCPAGWTAQ